MIHAQRPLLVTGPTETPVSLAEAKAHLRVDHDIDDVLITGYIAAAVSTIDGWAGHLGRCLVTQTWSRAFSGFPCGDLLRLPFPNAADIVVSYYPSAGSAATGFSSDSWHHVRNAEGDAVRLGATAVWPSPADRPDAVTATAAYGYGDPADVPGGIKAALLLMVGDLYRNRETVAAGSVAAVPMSTTVEALLAPHRYGWAGV